MNKKRSENIKKPKVKTPWYKNLAAKPSGKYLYSMLGTWCVCGVIALFLLYGPWSGFRDFMITSTETTINHKHISRLFYPMSVIEKVMSKHTVTEFEGNMNMDDISTTTGENDMTLTEISKDGYKAWMLEISDPSTVMLGVSKYFGVKGQKIPYLLENYENSVAGINAGGFGDADGFGNGGIPIGLVISEGEELYKPNKSTYNIVGFDTNNVLVVGKYKKSELESLNLRDACEFTPVLIMNGEPAEIKGNGGWGIAPRTAIGQRKDGTVVFVVVDGRSAKSLGVTMKDLRDIMIEQGCYNAANLDGGSSTVLSYKDEIINEPSGSDSDGMRFLPNAFIVVDED